MKRSAAHPGRAVFICAFGAAAAACLACILFFGIRYEVNDDACISNIASGAFGPGSQYLIHVNILLGHLLRPLYAVVPGANWYLLASLFFTCLGFAGVGYALWRRLGARVGWVAYGLLLAVCGSDMFCRFQYTKTSTVMLVGGLALILCGLGRLGPCLRVGFLLVLVGSMARFESCLPVCAIAAFALLEQFIQLRGRQRWVAVVSGAVVLAACLGAEGVNQYVYTHTPGWDSYMEFNDARTRLSDYQFQFLTDRTQFYAQGFDDTDYALLAQWDFYDKGYFTPQRLETLCESIPRPGLLQAARTFALRLPSLLFGHGAGLAFVAAAAAAFLLGDRRRRLAAAGVAAVTFAGLFGLLYLGRLIYRVEVAFLFAGAVFLALLAVSAAPRARAARRCAALIVAVCALGGSWYLWQLKAQNDYYLGNRLPQDGAYNAVSADKEHLFVLDTASFDRAMGYDVFRPRPAGYFSNMVFLGSWTARSPHAEQVLAAYGLQEPMVELPGAARALFCPSDNPAAVVDYLSRQTRVQVSLVPVEGYGVPVYRVEK